MRRRGDATTRFATNIALAVVLLAYVCLGGIAGVSRGEAATAQVAGGGSPPGVGAGRATPQDQEAAILAAVQRFFDAMEAADAAALADVLLAEGQFFSIRIADDGFTTRAASNQSFIDTIAGGGTDFLERMWEPTVLIHGRLATVWTPYDFHRDGVFSHCGVDSFNLVRTDDGWKIANGAYTVEPTGCPPSPLGPPRR